MGIEKKFSAGNIWEIFLIWCSRISKKRPIWESQMGRTKIHSLPLPLSFPLYWKFKVSNQSMFPSWITVLLWWNSLHSSKKCELNHAGPPKIDWSLWRVLTKHGWFTGEGNNNSLQYPCQEYPMNKYQKPEDKGALCPVMIHEVAKSWMQLSNWTTYCKSVWFP